MENKRALQSDYMLVVLSSKSCFMIFVIFLPLIPSPSPVPSGCQLWSDVTLSEERVQANISEEKPPL